MNIKGKLIKKSDTVDVSASFRKREFVIEFAENPQYPELLQFELVQGNCEQLDSFNAGDELDVSFNLKGRKWTSPQGEEKYFNSLQAWKIEGTGSHGPVESRHAQATSDDDDDLPF
jgi:hypothetical protein